MSLNIFDENNYEKLIHQNDIKNYILIYNSIVNNFIELAVNNIEVNNKYYYNYIFNKGIITIQNVFKFLLLYTKNIEMIKLYCEKAFMYYIEFIGQIGSDSTSYLQLTCKDAILFVYKKTIYEISNDFKKMFELNDNEKKIIDIIDIFIKNIYIYRTKLFTIYDLNNKLEEQNNVQVIKNLTFSFINKMLGVINNESIITGINKLNTVQIFLYNFNPEEIYYNKYSTLCETFCKKIQKVKEPLNISEIKFIDSKFNYNLKNMNSNKFISWLLN